MNVFRRILGIHDDDSDPHSHQRAASADAHLERERAEFRQAVQRVDSGARVLENKNNLIRTWDEGLQMIARKYDD